MDNYKTESLHETKQHGKTSFPYAVYWAIIPDFLDSFPLHWHDEMEIIYVKNGVGTVTVQSHEYVVKSGDIVIIPPQTVHSISGYENESFDYNNVLFHFSMITGLGGDITYEKYLRPIYMHTLIPPYLAVSGSKLNEQICGELRELIENKDRRDEWDELMIKSNLYRIMHYICKSSEKATDLETSLHNNYDRLKNVLSLVQTNFAEQISVEEAAKICGYSPSYFMKIFRDLTGRSFNRYLVDYRLEQAATRLSKGKEKIIVVSEECGFNNLSYFTRAFEAKYSMSPSKYRRRG